MLKSTFLPCNQCLDCSKGMTCTQHWIPMVSSGALEDWNFISAARATTAKMGVGSALWIDEVFYLRSKLPIKIGRLSCTGAVKFWSPDLENLFLPTDADIDAGRAEKFIQTLRYWFSDFLETPSRTSKGFITEDRKETVRAVLSLVAAHRPTEWLYWMSHRPQEYKFWSRYLSR